MFQSLGDRDRRTGPASPQGRPGAVFLRGFVGCQERGFNRSLTLPSPVDRDEHWMWVARVLRRSDEYKRRRTCRRGKAVNSKKPLPVPTPEKLARSLLLAADLFNFFRHHLFVRMAVPD